MEDSVAVNINCCNKGLVAVIMSAKTNLRKKRYLDNKDAS